ncbi:MAG: cobalt-precorrin-5B (C(1))-methyltransferase [Pseudomonadota bacterium]
MTNDPATRLKRGWTTGACATAATKAALQILWGGTVPQTVSITLPRGEMPVFAIQSHEIGEHWVKVGIEKDAGDDPDVTHGAIIQAGVRASAGGVVFKAGEGVGVVTKPGLPIAVGEPAINPVPRQLMADVVQEVAAEFGQSTDIEIEISVPGGRALAAKTWNPRLGIEGGLSILGTTGVVRPFSCAAWIASIHRGIDVAVATRTAHVAGCTGATSEAVVQKLHQLPDHAMLDMGDFAGGLLKYLAKHPVKRFTLGGGIGKLTKFAQGARDLHSKRSQVDFALLGDWADAAGLADVRAANTALEASEIAGEKLCAIVAEKCEAHLREMLAGTDIMVDVVIIDRAGKILARAG